MTPESAPPQRVAAPASPCIKVCVLDARNVCIGCGRTIEEIAGWAGLTAEEQWRICERAARRRQDAGPTNSR